MKRKYFLVILFLILAIFLSGCGIVTDEGKIRDVIDEYFLAISNQDWNKAEGFCIYDSDLYYETCIFEDYINSLYQFSSFVIVNCQVDIFDIIITGNYARAYIDGRITILTDDFFKTNNSAGYFYLQKVDNDWKVYSQDYIVK